MNLPKAAEASQKEYYPSIRVGDSVMTGICWIGLNTRERRLVLDALTSLHRSDPKRAGAIDTLTAKLVHAAPYPSITVGVHGGQVQWTLGNPFPIRVCDYDGASVEDLPDIDERGHRCRIWWEPANSKKSERTSSRID